MPIRFEELEQIAASMATIAQTQQQVLTAQQQQLVLLNKISNLLDHHPVKLAIVFNGDFKRIGDKVQITDIQSVSATIAETDAAGNPVQLDPSVPAPVWAAGDPNIIDVQTQADGSVVFKAKGPLGSSQVSVNYGGLSAQDQIDVVNSAATTLGIKFGTPQ